MVYFYESIDLKLNKFLLLKVRVRNTYFLRKKRQKHLNDMYPHKKRPLVHFYTKKQVQIITTHHTNIKNKELFLLFLIMLSMLEFFFILKDKALPSSHCISRKSILPTVTFFIDSVLHCFFFYLLFHLSMLPPLAFLIIAHHNIQPPFLITSLKIKYLLFVYLLVFALLTFPSSVL